MREQTGRTGRRVAAGVAALLVLACATACAPEPSPTPTPTGFASEEEAFAAAEQTYRDYVDALNHVDLADPTTFEPLFALTTGGANAAARKEFSGMHAEGLEVGGESRVLLVSPSGHITNTAVLEICVDVSRITLVDPDGNSAVAPDRADVQPMEVTLDQSDDADHGWLISGFAGREGAPECPGT